MEELKISKRTEPAMFTIRVDKSLVDFYDHLAQQTNRSRNEVISMALEFAREHIRIDENDGGK
ncbi:MAG: ribbon-helix-helix protein, CopG family [Anaerotruncus sp.]|jgi:predicted transcriptional regulator|nr:ribbon-helix-helix protein, CopG family [Anaerotruncus sp.]